MAERFHIRNGAKFLAKHEKTQNFEYEICWSKGAVYLIFYYLLFWTTNTVYKKWVIIMSLCFACNLCLHAIDDFALIVNGSYVHYNLHATAISASHQCSSNNIY